jgi:hypothetical protein
MNIRREHHIGLARELVERILATEDAAAAYRNSKRVRVAWAPQSPDTKNQKSVAFYRDLLRKKCLTAE